MFRGRFEHTIDDKGRLAVPSRYRDLIALNNDDNILIVTNFDRCLAAYSLPTWEKLEKAIAAMPQFDRKVMAFLRYFISGASECSIDKSGRILVPQSLRQSAKLEGPCVIAGNLQRFEIWSETQWKDEFESLEDQFVNINDAMGQMGLSL